MNNTLFATANFNEQAEFADPKVVSDIETATSTVIQVAEPNDHANALANAAASSPFDKLAQKYNITPRVIEEIAAAIVSSFGAANAESRHDLAAASFSPVDRPKLDESNVTSQASSTTFHGPTEWKVSYHDGKPNYGEGRALLQKWIDHHLYALRLRETGVSSILQNIDVQVTADLQPLELKFEPLSGQLVVVVRDRPISQFIRRIRQAYAALRGYDDGRGGQWIDYAKGSPK